MAENERSFPFSSGQGLNVTEPDWSSMAGGWQDSGVDDDPSGDGLTVVPGPSQNTIQVNPGRAQIDGFHYRLAVPKVVNTTPNPNWPFSRVDLVVLRLDLVTKEIVPEIILDATVAELDGSDGRIPLAEWTQLPEGTATPANWGSAADRRWFMGRRMRPGLEAAKPPAEPGAFLNVDGTLYVGADNAGTPEWQPWDPFVSTAGGSTIEIDDTTTQALRVELPAGDRSTAPDTMGVYVDGQRTTYLNEYGELRVIPSATSRVPFRAKALPSQTANLTEWADLNNVAVSWVDPAGGGHFPVLKVNEAPVSTDHGYSPADYGLKAWNGDPGYLAGSLAVPAGVVRLLKIKVPQPMTITNVVLFMAGASIVLTAGQNFAALYSTAGTRVALSVDQTTAWQASGASGTKHVVPMTAPFSAPAGFVYAAVLVNGGTPPNMGRFAQNTIYSNIAVTPPRFGSFSTGLTAMPASITPASIVSDATAAFWAGVS